MCLTNAALTVRRWALPGSGLSVTHDANAAISTSFTVGLLWSPASRDPTPRAMHFFIATLPRKGRFIAAVAAVSSSALRAPIPLITARLAATG